MGVMNVLQFKHLKGWYQPENGSMGAVSTSPCRMGVQLKESLSCPIWRKRFSDERIGNRNPVKVLYSFT